VHRSVLLMGRWETGASVGAPALGCQASGAAGACLLPGGDPRELSLERVHVREVLAGVVVATLLPGRQSEPAPRVAVARSAGAEVDDGRQILLLRQRGGADLPARECPRDVAVQHRRGQLDGVTGDYPTVDPVEPARMHVVPGALFHHHVVVNAKAPRLAKRRVG